MKRVFLRLCTIGLFAILAAGGPAMGQTIALLFSGSGTSAESSSGSKGSGSGTLSPGGAATLSFTASNSNDNCTNIIQFSFKVIVDANNTLSLFFSGQIPASIENSGSGTINGTLTVTGGTGTYSGKGGTGTGATSVTLGAKTNGSTPFTYNLSGSVTLAGPVIPVATINPSGIVPVYSDSGVIQSGSWISIYGNNLANATTIWNGDFPTSLGGVTVTINGKPGYLWFTSSGQINLQAPDDTKTGCVPVVVNTPNGTVTTSVDLESISPSFSLLPNSSYVAAVILTPNGSGAYGGGTYDLAGPVGFFSFPTRPAKRGETLQLYGVGFGPTNPGVRAGQVFSGAAKTINTVQVGFFTSGTFIQTPVSFSGLVGAGLDQINITIPSNAPSGDLSLQAIVGPANGNGVQTSSDMTILLPVQ